MIGILAEDRSDADALKVIVRRLSSTPNVTVKAKGFSGCGELCRKAGAYLNDFETQGITRVVICHDADGPDPGPALAKVHEGLRQRGVALGGSRRIIVPVQELEAWIIADEAAIAAVIPLLRIRPVARPETQGSPKEWLIGESSRGRSRPLYVPTTYNARVAEHLDFAKVSAKCPSFNPLMTFVNEAAAAGR